MCEWYTTYILTFSSLTLVRLKGIVRIVLLVTERMLECTAILFSPCIPITLVSLGGLNSLLHAAFLVQNPERVTILEYPSIFNIHLTYLSSYHITHLSRCILGSECVESFLIEC